MLSPVRHIADLSPRIICLFRDAGNAVIQPSPSDEIRWRVAHYLRYEGLHIGDTEAAISLSPGAIRGKQVEASPHRIAIFKPLRNLSAQAARDRATATGRDVARHFAKGELPQGGRIGVAVFGLTAPCATRSSPTAAALCPPRAKCGLGRAMRLTWPRGRTDRTSARDRRARNFARAARPTLCHVAQPFGDQQLLQGLRVTFATSTLERVIEEQARADSTKVAEIRSRIEHRVGGSIGSVIPGSAEAQALKELLIAEGLTNGIHARAIAGRRPHGHSRRSWARPRTPCRRGIVQIGLVAVAIPAPVRRPLLALHAQEPFALSINRPKPLYRVTQPGKEPLAAACMISLPMLSG